jgi:hypothetical protein
MTKSQKHPPSLEPMLCEHQVAEIFSISTATLRRNRLLNKGIPWVKLGGSVRYRVCDIEAEVKRNMRGPSQAVTQ